VTGDGDFASCIETALTRSQDTDLVFEVWSWSHSVSTQLQALCTNRRYTGRVSIHTLDKYFDRIGKLQLSWTSRAPLPKRRIELPNLLHNQATAERLQEWISKQRAMVCYAEGDLGSDLMYIVVPESRNEDAVDFDELTRSAKAMALEARRLLEPTAPSMPTTDNISANTSLSFTSSSAAAGAGAVNGTQRLHPEPCRWRKYCAYALKSCTFWHSADDLEFVRKHGPRQLRGTKLCTNGPPCRRRQCTYAHHISEVICPTCETTGHELNEACMQKRRELLLAEQQQQQQPPVSSYSRSSAQDVVSSMIPTPVAAPASPIGSQSPPQQPPQHQPSSSWAAVAASTATLRSELASSIKDSYSVQESSTSSEPSNQQVLNAIKQLDARLTRIEENIELLLKLQRR